MDEEFEGDLHDDYKIEIWRYREPVSNDRDSQTSDENRKK